MKTKETYRDFEIEQGYYGFWFATHKDYDGPEDNRHFWEKTKERLLVAIDEYHEENDNGN